MKRYTYRPVRYFCTVFAFTWVFWIVAAIVSRSNTDNGTSAILMILGLFVPTVTTIITVLTSKSIELKRDFKKKITGFYRIRPWSVLVAIAVMGIIIGMSILLSLIFGESTEQFSFVEGFSFSIGGIPTLLTLVLTASLEEFGWRGYAQDSLANQFCWLKASVIFGLIWAIWHLPLFFILDTYQNGLVQMNPWFAVNFFVGIPPMAILFTWVYVKNNRSIFACILFHFFVNLLQEQIAMTQITKCVETFVVYIVVAIIVWKNKEMFLETQHKENILSEGN